MSFQPIENYGVIGNMQSVALVGMNGAIDFLCYPTFDSPTVLHCLMTRKEAAFRFLTFLSVTSSAAQDRSLPPTAEVVAQMLARDAQRQLSLEGYAGIRRYILVNEHLHERAEVIVRVCGDPDERKHFEIVSETRWKAARKHVLHKILELEVEASEANLTSVKNYIASRRHLPEHQ